MTDCSLRKNERLLSRSDFENVLSLGQKRRVDRSFIIYTLANGLNRKRLGIIASKKIGNAVIRNRAKRKIREAYRRIKYQIKPAMDIVVISGCRHTVLVGPAATARQACSPACSSRSQSPIEWSKLAEASRFCAQSNLRKEMAPV